MTLKSLNTFAYTIFIFLFSLQFKANKNFIPESVNKPKTENSLLILMPPPPPTFTYITDVFCKNNPVSGLTVAVGGGPATGGTFSYMPNTPNALILNPFSGEITPGTSTPGTYTITFTGDMSQVVVTIAPIASTNIAPSGMVSLCPGQTVALTAIPLGAMGYSWSTSSSSNFSNANPLSISPTVTTTYSVTIKDSYGCVYSNIAKVVNVNPGPSNVSVNSRSICAGGTTSLAITGSLVAGTTQTWLPGASTNSVLSNLSPASTQVYSVNITTPGCPGFKTYTTTISVQPVSMPTVGFNYPYPICTDSGDKLPIKDTGFVEGGTFFYTSVDGENIALDNVTGRINMANMPVGVYFVSYSLAPQGCTLGGLYIDDVPLGQVSYITVSKDMLVTEGTGTMLIASNATEYKWVPDIYLNCSDCPSPYVIAQKSQRYCVSDPTNGCAREACVLVEVVCVNRGDMSVPSAFTPNNDGRNDKFCLQGWKYCVSDFRIRIFNRWGQLVYETKENDFCWDGTFNGQDLDAGVYVYSIEAVLNREPYSKKGNITIIR